MRLPVRAAGLAVWRRRPGSSSTRRPRPPRGSTASRSCPPLRPPRRAIRVPRNSSCRTGSRSLLIRVPLAGRSGGPGHDGHHDRRRSAGRVHGEVSRPRPSNLRHRDDTSRDAIPTERAASTPDARIAVAIPCYNEAAAIATVVASFRAALPAAEIVVFDNNSTDGTGDIARGLGVRVVGRARAREGPRGAGGVRDARRLRRHPAHRRRRHLSGRGRAALGRAGAGGHRRDDRRSAAADARRRRDDLHPRRGQPADPRGVSPADRARGTRTCSRDTAASAGGSGSRCSSARSGFEIETELAGEAVARGLRVLEISVPYHPRIAGTTSKLRAFRDGRRILATIIKLGFRLRMPRPEKRNDE